MSRQARIIVTGSRFWEDDVTIAYAINQASLEFGSDMIVVEGECPVGGADILARNYAIKHGFQVERFYPEFDSNGRIRGPERNQKMVNAGGDLCLAFPIGSSRGTKDCIWRASQKMIPVKVYAPNFNISGGDVVPNTCDYELGIHFKPHRGCKYEKITRP